MSDRAELNRILATGRDQAEVVAQNTLKRLQSAMGLLCRS